MLIGSGGDGENSGFELVQQRQAWLLDKVANERRVTTNEAAAQLDVSVDTVRRDLRLLHEQGLLRRVHGGAVPVARLPDSFTGRSADPAAGSSALSARIVERFKPGQVVGLDGGSTCVAIAAMIPSTLSVTIITNNPAAAVALGDHASATVILLGGTLDLTWMTATGADTVDAWRNYRLDIGVLGVCGLDAEGGLTTNSGNEVATKRALIAASTDVIVPVHPDKVGVCAPYVVADLDSADVIVTTAPLPENLARAALESGGELDVAGNP